MKLKESVRVRDGDKHMEEEGVVYTGYIGRDGEKSLSSFHFFLQMT